MDNIILKDNGDAIGYYSDLTRFNKKEMQKAVEINDWESVETFIEVQREMERWSEYDGLLVVSENNGMGWTAQRYKEDYTF